MRNKMNKYLKIAAIAVFVVFGGWFCDDRSDEAGDGGM